MTRTAQRARGARSRGAKVLLLITLVGALVAATVAPAMAARGGKNAASIAIDYWNPHAPFGELATFTVSSGADLPWVNARCYQGGAVVYSQWHGYFEGYRFDQVFTLGPTPSWTGGNADCVAEVGTFAKSGKFRAQASTTFSVVDETP